MKAKYIEICREIVQFLVGIYLLFSTVSAFLVENMYGFHVGMTV